MGRLESPYHLRRGGDGDGGGVLRVLVRPFHGQRRRKIASKLGAPPKYGTRLPRAGRGHMNLTTGFRDIVLFSVTPFPFLSLVTSVTSSFYEICLSSAGIREEGIELNEGS